MTPQAPYNPGPAEMTNYDLGELDFQVANEWARRGRAAQEAVYGVIRGVPPRPSGALGMKEGDVLYDRPSGFVGIAGEFTQDGDVHLTSLDGDRRANVRWNNCELFSGIRDGRVVTEGKIVGAQG